MLEIFSAVETFQTIIHRVVQYLPSVPNNSEDILIFGKIQEVHRKTLTVIFDCLTAINLTFHNANLKLNEVML